MTHTKVHIYRSFFIVCILVNIFNPLYARNKIGLVLSGGGARGAAHIGVLKTLEKHNIIIDYIAGTSMGAIVGGLYASGLSAQEIEDIFTSMDWVQLFDDTPLRHLKPYRTKKYDRLLLNNSEIGLKDGKLNTQKGILVGQKLDFLLKWHTLHAAEINNFDNLAIKFRALAVNLESGKHVVLEKGNLAQAMRASMSIPGVFNPTEIKNEFLIDGGILKNLPIDIIKDMGADTIIAVDVGEDLKSIDELNSPIQVLSQTTKIISIDMAHKQQEQLSDDDIMIQPDLQNFSTFDFLKTDLIINLGERSANKLSESLKKFSVSKKKYDSYKIKRTSLKDKKWTPDFIKLNNRSHISNATIIKNTKTKPGKALDKNILKSDIDRIYSMGEMEQVIFFPVLENKQKGLLINIKEKDWTGETLKLGFDFLDTFDKQSKGIIRLGYKKTHINSLGGHWFNTFETGSQQSFHTEFNQPLTFSRLIFISADAYSKRYTDELCNNAEMAIDYLLKNSRAGVDLGWNISENYGILSIGIFKDINKLEANTENPQNFNAETAGYRLQLLIDQLDDINFPHKGKFLNYCIHTFGNKTLSNHTKYSVQSIKYIGAHSYKNNTMLFIVKSKNYFGEGLPVYERNKLGGFLNMSGSVDEDIYSKHMAIAELVYLRPIRSDLSFLKKIFLGISFELSNSWDILADYNLDDSRYAGSIFLGFDTFLGPLYLAHGHSDGGNNASYIKLGTVF